MEKNKDNNELNNLNEIKEKITVTNDGVGLFERFLIISKQYTLKEILKACAVAIIICSVGFLIVNPTYFFEKYEEYEKEKHATELTERFNLTKEVNSTLQDGLYELHADRIFFIEYHNSIKSLQGAPFAYGSMSFEKIHSNRNVIFMGDEFTDFPLTKYDMVSFLYDKKFFIGTIEDLSKIDERLACKLKTNDVTQAVLIEVWGDNQPLGILGATWSNYEVLSTYRTQIEYVIRNKAAQIRTILN